MSEDELTLSIETAVRGGSLALLRGTAQLDYWVGKREVSKSEDVLAETEKILKRNNIKKKEVDKIVVSRGPGSYTGARIGMAIAYGLKRALNCRLSGVSVLEAMVLKSLGDRNYIAAETIAAVPFGRNQVCRQTFIIDRHGMINQSSKIYLSTIEEFKKIYGASAAQIKRKFVFHNHLESELSELPGKRDGSENTTFNVGENLAGLLGMCGADFSSNGSFQLIYLKSDEYARS